LGFQDVGKFIQKSPLFFAGKVFVEKECFLGCLKDGIGIHGVLDLGELLGKQGRNTVEIELK